MIANLILFIICIAVLKGQIDKGSRPVVLLLTSIAAALNLLGIMESL